jgi:hypothetical protein
MVKAWFLLLIFTMFWLSFVGISLTIEARYPTWVWRMIWFITLLIGISIIVVSSIIYLSL